MWFELSQWKTVGQGWEIFWRVWAVKKDDKCFVYSHRRGGKDDPVIALNDTWRNAVNDINQLWFSVYKYEIIVAVYFVLI